MAFSEQDLEEFKIEAFEMLEAAEKGLLSLDQGATFKSVYDSVFRCFHNLKGGAGMMEQAELQTFMHQLENILVEQKNSDSISKETVDLFLNGVDRARQLLCSAKVQAEQPVSPVQAVTSNVTPSSSVNDDFFAECEEIVDRLSKGLQLIESQNYNKGDVDSIYRDIHSLKGGAYLLSFRHIGDMAHAIEGSLESLRIESQTMSSRLVNTIYECIKLIEAEVVLLKHGHQSDEAESKVQRLAQQLVAAASEVKLKVVSSVVAIPTPVPHTSLAAESAAPSDTNAKFTETENTSSIRVPVSLLDNLMALMGEMVLVRNQVIQYAANSESLEFLNLSKKLNVVTSEIQEEMMKTRMQPIGTVFNKFSRVVRELAQSLNKEISLTINGADTELDKSLLEAVKDPLTHIIRNSCDHGIESPKERSLAGKDKAGRIHVRAFHEGGQVVIEIKDDGRGLHRETILKKAVEKSLVPTSVASTMSEKEVYNLIFLPGFSTATSVTNVSGRGVGMDVVRTNIEKIGGSVELNSVSGKSTIIKLKIPLTLAIVPALIVNCSGEKFALPQVKLEELVRVDQASTENKVEYLHGSPVLRLRGNILPLIDLNKVMGLARKDSSENVSNIAILNADQCRFGLIVDEVQDTADIVVKPLNRLLKALHVYSGATILGDGSIALILDVTGLAKVARLTSESQRTDAANSAARSDMNESEKQDYLIVRLNSPTKHAIVLGYVHRLEEFRVSAIERTGANRVIRYGESILHMVSVSEQLGYKVTERNIDDTMTVVVIEKSGVLYGLEVEEIVDTFATDVEVDSSLVTQPGIFGNLNTATELIVAIDPFEIINRAFPESMRRSKAIRAEAPAVAEVAAAVNPVTMQILLAEDTVFFRKAVTKILVQAGYKVDVAVDGREALDKLEKDPEKYQILISDIEMPRMNGFELAQAVRSKSALRNLPMLALSSRADQNFSKKGLECGYHSYLEKLNAENLLEAVNQLTVQQRKAI